MRTHRDTSDRFTRRCCLWPVTATNCSNLATAILTYRSVAALDAVFGAFRSVLDGLFNDRIFVISFLSNVLVAALIVFLGDQLGVGSQMSTGVVVVLTMRIFANVAAVRRHLLKA